MISFPTLDAVTPRSKTSDPPLNASNARKEAEWRARWCAWGLALMLLPTQVTWGADLPWWSKSPPALTQTTTDSRSSGNQAKPAISSSGIVAAIETFQQRARSELQRGRWSEALQAAHQARRLAEAHPALVAGHPCCSVEACQRFVQEIQQQQVARLKHVPAGSKVAKSSEKMPSLHERETKANSVAATRSAMTAPAITAADQMITSDASAVDNSHATERQQTAMNTESSMLRELAPVTGARFPAAPIATSLVDRQRHLTQVAHQFAESSPLGEDSASSRAEIHQASRELPDSAAANSQHQSSNNLLLPRVSKVPAVINAPQLPPLKPLMSNSPSATSADSAPGKTTASHPHRAIQNANHPPAVTSAQMTHTAKGPTTVHEETTRNHIPRADEALEEEVTTPEQQDSFDASMPERLPAAEPPQATEEFIPAAAESTSETSWRATPPQRHSHWPGGTYFVSKDLSAPAPIHTCAADSSPDTFHPAHELTGLHQTKPHAQHMVSDDPLPLFAALGSTPKSHQFPHGTRSFQPQASRLQSWWMANICSLIRTNASAHELWVCTTSGAGTFIMIMGLLWPRDESPGTC
ncbi:MAG: hypothetical protein KatS3mg114_0184 [Planctomycetaceae bacterium]|nr:MAG: hypothetical protein KatS3mg114_0184 [Planctomycetaceae bacterium]